MYQHCPSALVVFLWLVAMARHCLDGNPTDLHVWVVTLNKPSIFYLIWLKSIFILLGFKFSFHHTNSSLYLCCSNQLSEIELAGSVRTAVKFALSTGNTTWKNPLVLLIFFPDCIIMWHSRHYTVSATICSWSPWFIAQMYLFSFPLPQPLRSSCFFWMLSGFYTSLAYTWRLCFFNIPINVLHILIK